MYVAAMPGFPCHIGMKRVKSLVFKGLAQIPCQSQATLSLGLIITIIIILKKIHDLALSDKEQ